MFRFGSFNPNTIPRGATFLHRSLFLAISVNNTQSIVCGGLEEHLPRPSGGDPVYLTDAAVQPVSLWNIQPSPLALLPPQSTHHNMDNKTEELAFTTDGSLVGNCKSTQPRHPV